ncbi:HNH endonuclease signature motif containing protein [Myceligenerans pegani]|uniref:HNH endonuclease n=1 Tax=Myceligenerans pegani TaxID=2776917 RepID=A0ABR9MWC3_9MICO|nr:HNH endonuclease signature motif containing protein [Myceligenerans sp. TRM 65318]MBE1875301.1 HNH endonuclease [Myceligenerans sp. TRM 65318]MBE3017572.1 HNH endonuclease [Myceligenerans sp. TRM 65318]
MAGSMFDDGAGRAPSVGIPPGEVEWVGPTGAIDYRCAEEFGRGFDDCGSDDADVVDEFGRPVPAPDHTERELAAILATDPYADRDVEASRSEVAGTAGCPHGGVGAAGGTDRGTGGGVSSEAGGRDVVVDVSRLLLEDVDRLSPGVALAGVLRDLAGLEPPFGARRERGAVDGASADRADADRIGVDDASGRASESLESLADDELRSVIAGWERVASWVRAAQARVAAELMARTDGPLGRDSAAGEIAAELHVTTPEGWQIAMRGEGTAMYPRLGESLAAGRIDTRKADTFLRAGTDLTPEERGEAIDDLLPGARTRTWRWVSEQMNARAADLHGRKARRREIIERCNVWAEQAGPGMGRLIADLPVVDAARTFNTVQAAAKALKDTSGETRPLGALRAAALAALITGDLVLPCPDSTNTTGTGTGTGIDEAGDGNRGIDHHNADHHNAGSAGHGATTGRGGELGRGDEVVGEPPRLVEPVLDTDLIPIPDDPHGIVLTGPAHGATGSAPTSNNTGNQDASAAESGSHTRLRVVDVSTTVNVTVPATMLLDPEDTTPGILEGIGPIPADSAARIAADATWRRLLTDPVTGVLTDYSARTYTPGSILRAAVTARDHTCRFPGCHRPATTGGRAALDLDHIRPFDHDHRYQPGEPGQTRATNLHPLCRKHHNLKTHANWQVTRDADTGTTRWTPPSGTPAVVEPGITDPTIRYALAHGMTLAAPPTTTGSGPGEAKAGRPRGRHPETPPF